MSRRIAVRGVIVNAKGELFCVRHKAYGNTDERTFWCVPGGGLDSGEALVDGVVREIMEETGVHAKTGKLLFIQQYGNRDKEELEFFFDITNWEDFVGIDISKSTHSNEEIAEFGFIDPKQTYVLPKFLSEVDIRVELKSISSPKIFNYFV